MAKRLKFDESGDSDDLQSLFDSIAGGTVAPIAPPRHLEVVSPAVSAGGDDDELQALFDSVADEYSVSEQAGGGEDEPDDSRDKVFNRIGVMTRQLHDTLRELGYDRSLQEAAHAIPDARQRLTYIAEMTEQAASKVLNATDIAKPIQDRTESNAAALKARWDRLYAQQMSPDEFRVLAGETRDFLGHVVTGSRETGAQLMEIMMAQDFQDLTGQVIKKVVDLAQGLEQQLLQVLIEAMPAERKAEASETLMNGPVINAVGRDDVVSSQEQVDDLLESLGF
ncbi:protein phosphatase CheZ [Zoogloea sp.]|jgi:chemotaxis protein CheZ|uniref:protein phosphatase CheZ n=1 Tax=Zoogloea sp. TaxID=49181 RepID=UPI0011D5E14C|nr:protein phosphatase CheZ [Zoogloea sp.]MBK6656222.1 protein phosphatase CheZ [Zoogloea sp.]MBK7848872.1 protein phosphatase CheZ [Zoogloea sp.]MBP7443480.1 protein phosphatase CheZ [Zoogloea sp.]TXG97488.1 MAG: protein phosphatase CheZ [Zoogloea sp.]HOY00452.1 protein phosphatase CheZ [Zoogloea sp.]